MARLHLATSAVLLALAVPIAGCATTPPRVAHLPEAELFDPAADAGADVDAALARARMRGVATVIVLGANWCHDSRALAGWTVQPKNATFLAANFETVFVDVGTPQTGKGRNAAILARYAMPAQTNTPLVLVVSPEGKVLNADSAASWKNAASRSEADIREALAQFAASPPH